MEKILAGFKQVDSFGPDEEYEDEVEEVYVTLDLGNVEPTLIPGSSTYRLIGLDESNAYMQVGGTFFQGKLETLLGSELIFQEGNPDEEHKKHLVYFRTTDARIEFKTIELKEKETGAESNEDDETASAPRKENDVRVPRKGKGKDKDVSFLIDPSLEDESMMDET